MSKVIIFSDLHIHDYQNFNKDGQRLTNCLRVLEDLFEFANKYGINTILFGGDLFDTPKVLLTSVMNESVKTFIKLFETYPDIKFYAITGNHDQNRKNLIDRPADASNQYLASIFPDNFILFDNKSISLGDDIYISGIPYYEHPEHYSQCLDATLERLNTRDRKLGGEYKDYLFIHQTPHGLGNEMIPTDTNPKDERYKRFEHVFCGHIHARQDLTDHFTVIGSPIHRDMGDVGENKGFIVMNLAKPENGYKFFELKDYPKFQQRFDDEEEFENEEDNFVIVKPKVLHVITNSDAPEVEKFNTSLENAELLRNYWEAVDGKNEELLEIGLSFIS